MEWADETRSRCLLVSSKDSAHLKSKRGRKDVVTCSEERLTDSFPALASVPCSVNQNIRDHGANSSSELMGGSGGNSGV